MITPQSINSWKKFSRNVRPKGCSLLKRLDEFPSSILVAGCQRSGTTVLSRVIRSSECIYDFCITDDDELDAALILSGHIDYDNKGRHCFQTTYLNECYPEYFDHDVSHKIIWVIRNPLSVVYSLLHNWTREPLNNLFESCGVDDLTDLEISRYQILGGLAISRLRKACLAYAGKSRQVFEIINRLGIDRLIVVDYDDLVLRKEKILPMVYDFINVPYKLEYADMIHGRSIDKSDKLSRKERRMIKEVCFPVYEETKKLVVRV